MHLTSGHEHIVMHTECAHAAFHSCLLSENHTARTAMLARLQSRIQMEGVGGRAEGDML